MVRISSIVGVLIAMALGIEAGSPCQCLYTDGSHCCVSLSNSIDDCTAYCKTAVTAFDEKPCNANGKWSKVSVWNSQFRATCDK